MGFGMYTSDEVRNISFFALPRSCGRGTRPLGQLQAAPPPAARRLPCANQHTQIHSLHRSTACTDPQFLQIHSSTDPQPADQATKCQAAHQPRDPRPQRRSASARRPLRPSPGPATKRPRRVRDVRPGWDPVPRSLWPHRAAGASVQPTADQVRAEFFCATNYSVCCGFGPAPSASAQPAAHSVRAESFYAVLF